MDSVRAPSKVTDGPILLRSQTGKSAPQCLRPRITVRGKLELNGLNFFYGAGATCCQWQAGKLAPQIVHKYWACPRTPIPDKLLEYWLVILIVESRHH